LELYRTFPELDTKVLKEREMETVFGDALFAKEKDEKDDFHKACETRQAKFRAILASLPSEQTLGPLSLGDSPYKGRLYSRQHVG
jgi:hypothetical protein